MQKYPEVREAPFVSAGNSAELLAVQAIPVSAGGHSQHTAQTTPVSAPPLIKRPQ